MKWNDVSSRSRNESTDVIKSVEGKAGFLKICVTRYIHGDPAKWYLRWVESDLHELEVVDLEAAKVEATAIVKASIKKVLAALG